MEDLIINVRASKTSPHAGQKFPRHLFTLMCSCEEFIRMWDGWTSGPQKNELYLAYTQGQLILVNPLDPVRIKHYDAVPFMMREDTQNSGRMRGSVSNNQAPWLAEVDAQGLSDAVLVLQSTTDNYRLTWKRKVAPKQLKRAQNTGPSEIVQAAAKLAWMENLPPIGPAPDLKALLDAAPKNAVELRFSDGSTRLFENLTLAQMLEINVLLARYEDES